jgi:hypothetical protein
MKQSRKPTVEVRALHVMPATASLSASRAAELLKRYDKNDDGQLQRPNPKPNPNPNPSST